MNSPIGIFDSGVGGLTVTRAIVDLLPRENIIYFGDTLRGPFGPQPLTTVRRYALEISEFLESAGVKLIVIACNSATAAGLSDVQRIRKVPVIGVIEPGARAAVMATVARSVGVIGTNATISSGAYQDELKRLDAGIKISVRACPDLVEYVERGEVEGSALEAAICNYLEDMQESNTDTIILGCTHYPLIEKSIGKVAGPDVKLINSASEVALEVKDALIRRNQLRENGEPVYRFIFSGDANLAKKLGRKFFGPEVNSIETVTSGVFRL